MRREYIGGGVNTCERNYAFCNYYYYYYSSRLSFCTYTYSCINREDVIKVYDGYGPIATMVLLLCNEVAGTEIFSTGPNLYVEFVANDQWPGQGFKASYYFQSADGLHNFNEIQQAGERATHTYIYI